MKNNQTIKNITILVGLAVLMIIGAVYLSKIDVEYVKNFLLQFGLFAPVVCVIGMVLAVVVAPMPSLPFDLAAGALFGWFLGGIYSMTGAVIGSIIAFIIARRLGKQIMKKYAAEYAEACEACDENYIFILILISRLIPVISFDVISYAAGLTRISLWKYTVATIIGVIPITFLLTYSGSLLIYGSTLINVVLTIIILLTMFLIPMYMSNKKITKYVRKKAKKRSL